MPNGQRPQKLGDHRNVAAFSMWQMTGKWAIGWSKLVPYVEIVKGNVL